MIPSSRICFALAAGLLVFASRAWLIRTFGFPLPFWDEWDAEPPLYRAWLEGNLTWSSLIAAHNEHRILLTRLADLGLFILQGEWNVWSQLILNAVLHAVTAAAVVATAWNTLGARARAGWIAGVVLLFSAPSGWQNALYGFQSQVYFTNLLAVAAPIALLGGAPLSGRWWLGGIAAAVALFSNAGGALIAPAVLVAALLLPGKVERRTVFAWGILALLFVFALATRVTHPGHVPFHAHTATQFLGTLTHALSWPHIGSGWMWIALQIPIVGLVIERWRQHTPLTAAERCAIALAAFAALHAAAIAYSRGGGLRGFQPLSRYQDPMVLGAAAQLFAALQLARTQGRGGRLTLIGWSAVTAFGLLTLSESHLTLNLPYKRSLDRANFAAVRAFLDAPANDRARVEPRLDGLHPEPATVRRVLEDPVLQPRLPAPLRTSLSPEALAAPGAIRHGLVLGIAAALLVGLSEWFRYRRTRHRHQLPSTN